MKRDVYKDLKCGHFLSLDFIISQLVQVLQHFQGAFSESQFVRMYMFSFFLMWISVHNWVMLLSCWTLWCLTEQTPELFKCDLSFFCSDLIFQWLVNPYLTVPFMSSASSRPLAFWLICLFVFSLLVSEKKGRTFQMWFPSVILLLWFWVTISKYSKESRKCPYNCTL